VKEISMKDRITPVLLSAIMIFGIVTSAKAAERCIMGGDIPAAPKLDIPKYDATAFDLQFLLSWSPYHCKRIASSKPKDKPKGEKKKDQKLAAWDARFQCQDNRFGFVVHGLWPQAEGEYGKERQPRACKPSQRLPRELLRRHLCTVPGVFLMQNEWQAHGTCNWVKPEDYFATIEELVPAFPMPTLESFQNRDVKVDEIVSAIVASSNGKLKAEMIGVRADQVASKRSLQEVYICMDLKLNPKPCANRGTPETIDVFVWPIDANP
jgi:ribonuclease T2